jgi:predicted MFS family arabinose efflux permease
MMKKSYNSSIFGIFRSKNLALMVNPWKGLKNIPKNMWILAIATLINRAGTMVIPFLAIYLTSEIKVSVGEAGFVLAVYGTGAFITSPFVGMLSDKIGAMRIMRLSLISSGFVLFLFSFITDYNQILIVTFIWAVLSEAFRPANLSLITEVVPPSQQRTAFALNRLAINLGMSIGPVAGGLLTMLDFSILFYVDGITAIAAGIFLYTSRWEKHPDTESPPDAVIETAPLKKSILKDYFFLYFLISIVPMQLVFFQLLGAFPLYIVQYLGYTPAVFGFLSAINTVIIIFVEVPLNDYLSNWSFKKTLAIGAILTGLGFGIFAAAGTIPVIITGIILFTFGEMIFFPVSAAYVSEVSPKNKMGEYMGYLQMTFSLSFLAGPWLGTIVLNNSGPVILWILAFFFSLITAVLMIKLKK